MNTRVLLAATILASIAATSCGGGGEGGGAVRPTNPAVTIRFIGPDGAAYAPKELVLFHYGVGDEFPMKTWEDGVTTDLGVQLVPGDLYDVMAYSRGRQGVFGSTTIRFTAPEGPIDLGTFDLRPLGITLISPAAGAVVTSYPVEFTWTAYENPDADQVLRICAELIGNGNGCVRHTIFEGTSYSLTAAEKADAFAGRSANWSINVSFTTTEGHEVWYYGQAARITLPE